MEGESNPLLSRANLEPDVVDKSRKGMSHSVHVVYTDEYNRRMPPVKELTHDQCMSYPGGLADSDESRNGYQRIGVIGDDSLVNLSMHHVVLRNKRAEHSTTDLQTFVHLVKASLGSGLLALPYAISRVGYIIGPVVLTVLGLMAIHSMILLVRCCQTLCKRFDVKTLDFGEVAEATFWQYKINKKIAGYRITEFTLGKIAKLLVNILLILTQFGFCCVYFVFMSQNLKQVFDASGVELDERIWIAILLPLVIVFCWIRNLDTLFPFSTVANLCIFFGLGVILYYVFYLFLDKEAKVFDESQVVAVKVSGTALPFFFGNALYSYEGIGMILPLENKMKTPKNFPRVLCCALVFVTIIYVAIGTLGYLAFGNNIEDSITLNLPKDKHLHSVVYHIAKLYLCYAIFVTYALVFYVPLDFMEPPLFRRLKIDKDKQPNRAFLFQIVFRSVLVLITAVLAVAIPELHLFISLIGAFASSILAIIIPPILQIMLFCQGAEPRWQKILWISKSVFIVAVGVVGFVTGTYTSVRSIVKFLQR